MTREERERFVRNTIAEFGFEKDGIRRIVDKWEDEIGEYFDEGRYAEQERRGAEG